MHLSMNGMNTTDELLGNERMVTERRIKPTGSNDLCLWRVFYCFYIDTLTKFLEPHSTNQEK